MAKGSPVKLAEMAVSRRSSARHLRRAAEARARKEAEEIARKAGGSIPAIKAALRRRKTEKKGKP
ncbi:hypothetical protein [Microcystis phage Mae-JY30]